MEIDLFSLLTRNEVLVLFLVIGLGYLLGKRSIQGFELTPTTGVLIVGLAMGSAGFTPMQEIQSLGFILFIYSVGFQAGPQFFSIFMRDGKRYFMLSLFTGAVSVGLIVSCQLVFRFPYGMAVGILAGALTSTPTLAAGQDFIVHGKWPLPWGISSDVVLSHLTVAYALSYIFGMVGIVVFAKYFARLAGVDLVKAASELEAEVSATYGAVEDSPRGPVTIGIRTFRVEKKDMLGKSLRDLQFRQRTGCLIDRTKRDGQEIEVTPDLVLREGDVVALIGDFEKLGQAREAVGIEVLDAGLLSEPMETAEIVVSKPEAFGKPLTAVSGSQYYNVFFQKLVRARLVISGSFATRLEAGDKVTFTGVKSHIERLARHLGHIERDVQQTDLFTFSLGICVGLMLGQLTVKLGGIAVGLGQAGGLLLAGLCIGYWRSYKPTFGAVPQPVRWVFMELGLLFFMASVGLNAGGGLVDAFRAAGPQIFLAGAILTVIPPVLSFYFGLLVLKMNPVLLMGGITGAMTSTPALNVLTSEAKSVTPALGYAGCYAFSNVIMVLAGTLLMRLLL